MGNVMVIKSQFNLKSFKKICGTTEIIKKYI